MTSSTILTLPIPLIMILICFLIVNLRIYHFKCLLGNYTFIIESYDLLRKSLVLLSIWLIMLIIIAQKRVNYKKLLLINMIILLYFVCIITFANFNCNNHKLKWVSKIKNNNHSRNAKFPMNNYGISLSSKVSDILCPSLVA